MLIEESALNASEIRDLDSLIAALPLNEQFKQADLERVQRLARRIEWKGKYRSKAAELRRSRE